MEERKKYRQDKAPWWMWLILYVVLLVGAFWFGWIYWQNTKPVAPDLSAVSTKPAVTDTSTPVPTVTPTPTSSPTSSPVSTAGWKTYTDKTYGFSFRYPTADVANVEPSNSDSYFNDSNVSISQSDEYWLYTVTVTPNTKNQTLAQVATQNFNALQAGILSYISEEKGSPVTFTQSNVSIGGVPAEKMVPNGPTAYSPSAEVVLIKNGNIIEIEPRAESDEFDAVLSTLQFTK